MFCMVATVIQKDMSKLGMEKNQGRVKTGNFCFSQGNFERNKNEGILTILLIYYLFVVFG